jgi:hypothetical protein
MKNSTNSDHIDEIILALQAIQETANRKYWKSGLFPNYRFNKYWFYFRKDNSIFFTASIVAILQNLLKDVSDINAKILTQIIERAISNYIDYQNIGGIETYNFYPTKPTQHFGNGYFFGHFKHFQLPDDVDDTALIYTTNYSNKGQAAWLQEKLTLHANNGEFKNKTLPQSVKSCKAFSTWFGKNMPIEFDTVVHANILIALLKQNLPLNESSIATWMVIKQNIIYDDFIFKPFEVSHNYASSITIAYHVAKLLEISYLPHSEEVKLKLINFLNQQNANTKLCIVERAMVSTSLMRLGSHNTFFQMSKKDIFSQKNYSYFLAGMLSAYQSKLLRFLAPFSFFHIRWRCEAHSLAILLENLVLRQKKA